MRNIKRIEVFLDILKKEWEKVPDQRFAQFMLNNGLQNTSGVAYYLEYYELLERMFPNIPKSKYLLWTSYGINGDEPPKTQLIKDLETSHIKNIINNIPKLNTLYREAMEQELKNRN